MAAPFIDAPFMNVTPPVAPPTNQTFVCEIDDGDTAWVLISTVLVLGMMPGLAFFEAGLLRAKNTMSIIVQVFGGLTVLAFMWDLFGYSLVFSNDYGGIIGDFANGLLIDVGYHNCSKFATNIPAASYALFMMMFASITPLLMTGSFAERIRFRSFIIFTILWEVLVFYPVAHSIWGDGWLARMGALDFAGGIVIHTTAGTGALVLALIMGRREGFDKHHGEFPPSNLPMAAIGAALLWMGWFGFNAGSALSADAVATSAVASTQIAACASGTVWLLISAVRSKPSTIAVMNGIIAGLAGITPASGYINSQATIVVGIILGLTSYGASLLTKRVFRIDDALDVSSVHGLTGIIGSLAIGFAAEPSINEVARFGGGVIYSGNGQLLGIQTLAVVYAIAHAGIITALLAFLLQKTIGLRVSEEDEEHGLDVIEHQETAYNLQDGSGDVIRSLNDAERVPLLRHLENEKQHV